MNIQKKRGHNVKQRETTISENEIFRNFWKNNDRFASLFNAAVFGGEDVVKPEVLIDSDNTEIPNGCAEISDEMNTVVKKTGYGVEFVLTGIKDQRDMPLHLLYQDSLGYLKECREIVQSRQEIHYIDNTDEVLGALSKEDRLKPIINLVMYYGKEPWNGTMSLKEMFPNVPEAIRAVLPDYRINLIQVKEAAGCYHFDNKDLQDVFQMAEFVCKDEIDKMYDYMKENKVKSEVAAMLEVLTGKA